MSPKDQANQEESDGDAPASKRTLTHGEKYGAAAEEFNLKDNSRIKEGIVKDRHCTDVFCFIIFFAFLTAAFGAVIYCIVTGDVEKALAPYDGSGHICGYD